MIKNLLLNKMIKTIIDYVNYHYQFCENIEPFLLTNNLDTNECYIKSCLIYTYLFELYFRKNVTLNEVMSLMNITDFYFTSNSSVLKNHLIFHHAIKKFYRRHKIGRYNIYIFDTRITSSFGGFLTGILYWFFHEGVV